MNKQCGPNGTDWACRRCHHAEPIGSALTITEQTQYFICGKEPAPPRHLRPRMKGRLCSEWVQGRSFAGDNDER
jgi:hypothetical protein